jgi:hypothetical protein
MKRRAPEDLQRLCIQRAYTRFLQQTSQQASNEAAKEFATMDAARSDAAGFRRASKKLIYKSLTGSDLGPLELGNLVRS